MSSIALCMVVKDEFHRIEGCLDPIHTLVDEIIIVDTGSTDGTPELIHSRFGIRVIHGEMQESRCLTKIDSRNLAFSKATTDWIISLDADERMNPDGLRRIRNMQHAPGVTGYFGLWRNHVPGMVPFDDYKCFMFRRGVQMRGLVHENAQSDIRIKKGLAIWLDEICVDHYPEARKHAQKTHLYRRRLMCALEHEPDWYRYNWFLGYMQFQAGEWDDAIINFARVLNSDSPIFPVERLNSAMVWIEMLCTMDRTDDAIQLIHRSRRLYDQLQDDFEVKVNNRLKIWFLDALEKISIKAHREVKAYSFAR